MGGKEYVHADCIAQKRCKTEQYQADSQAGDDTTNTVCINRRGAWRASSGERRGEPSTANSKASIALDWTRRMWAGMAGCRAECFSLRISTVLLGAFRCF